MPIYEYECESCGHRVEMLRKMDDADAQLRCEKCGQAKVHRVQSVFAAGVSAAGRPAAVPNSPCGRCGDPRGSCAM